VRLPLWPSLCLLASLPCSRLLCGVLLQSLLREVHMAAGRIILFIDELHLLMDAGRVEGGMNAGECGTGHWLELCAAVDDVWAAGSALQLNFAACLTARPSTLILHLALQPTC
jgi:hypothetical protein